MKHFTEFTIPRHHFVTKKAKDVKGKSHLQYLDMPVAFDLESSSGWWYNGVLTKERNTENDDELIKRWWAKVMKGKAGALTHDDTFPFKYCGEEPQELYSKPIAFAYIWMVGIDDEVYYGRYIEEFKQFMDTLVDSFNLSLRKRMVVYVHNLPFDFAYFWRLFKWQEDRSNMADGPMQPFRQLTTDGIEFRCSVKLSGMKLETLAKNIQTQKIEKLVGDLDYDLIRHSETELTEQELKYCEHDIRILIAYIKEQMQIYGNINNVPLTNTGRVRNKLKENLAKASNGARQRFKKMMSRMTVEPETYMLLKEAFTGGFTHGSRLYAEKCFDFTMDGMKCGDILYDVASYDFTSAYPSVMLSEKFPFETFTESDIKTVEELEQSNKAVLLKVKFTNLESKIKHENYFSDSKCETEGVRTNNGRIRSAKVCITTFTDVDWQTIKHAYSYDTIEFLNVYEAQYQPIPSKEWLGTILELYADKTTLKGIKGKEVEYLLKKGMLNSLYGMCVTDIVKPQWQIKNGEWVEETVDIVKQLHDYSNNPKRNLYYPWGVWITAFARRNLWQAILQLDPKDYVYADTDSLKLMNHEKYQHVFEGFNQEITQKIEKALRFQGLDPELVLSCKNQKGVAKPIGVWDFEGLYKRFAVMGAKQYIAEDYNGKQEITVAGLSKEHGLKWLKKQYGDPVEGFNKGFDVPSDESGKLTHTLIGTVDEFECLDYNGKKLRVKTYGGVHLEKCSFKINVAAYHGPEDNFFESEQYDFLKESIVTKRSVPMNMDSGL